MGETNLWQSKKRETAGRPQQEEDYTVPASLKMIDDFSRLKKLWIIEGELKLITPMRIGAGQESSLEYSQSSAPVLLSYDAENENYRAFIPGSSLKGVLRSTVERILRTYGTEYACALENAKKDNHSCVGCEIFGNAKQASLAVVRDSISSTLKKTHIVENRIHCATITEKSSGVYMIKYQDQSPKPKTNLINEENLPPNLIFPIRIEMQNATPAQVGLVLLALDEFNNRRSFIGGGTSRGYGVVDFKLYHVKSACPSLNVQKQISPLEWTDAIPASLISEFRRAMPSPRPISGSKDFDIYYSPTDTSKKLDGCITVKFRVVLDSNFHMKGVEQRTVLSGDHPVIPGSVIKGHLRHLCYRDARRRIEPVLNWRMETVDDMFGSAERNIGHKSRIHVSDIYFESGEMAEKYTGKDINNNPILISQGAEMVCWVMFDNVDHDKFVTLVKQMRKSQQISGNTSAKPPGRGRPSDNKLHFEIIEAWKFTIENPRFPLTPRLEAETRPS